PAVEEAVVVPARTALAFLLVKGLPESVLVELDREAGDYDRPTTEMVAKLEAQVEVSKPVDAEFAVDAARRERMEEMEGQRVSLQRIPPRARRGVEVTDPLLAAAAESPGCCDARLVECRHERAGHVAAQLNTGIEQDNDLARRCFESTVGGLGPARGRPYGQDPDAAASPGRQPLRPAGVARHRV